MKRTYQAPWMVIHNISNDTMLAASWSPDSRGGIDDTPQGQDAFGAKGNGTDDAQPWYRQ